MTLKDTIKNIHKSKISFYNIKRNNRLFLDLLKIGILIHSPFKRHTHHIINKEDLKYINNIYLKYTLNYFTNKVFFGGGFNICMGRTNYLKDLSNIFVHN
jgi:hypothetical protein